MPGEQTQVEIVIAARARTHCDRDGLLGIEIGNRLCVFSGGRRERNEDPNQKSEDCRAHLSNPYCERAIRYARAIGTDAGKSSFGFKNSITAASNAAGSSMQQA